MPDCRQERVDRARPLLGTLVAIGVRGLPPADAHRAIDAGFAAIADVHRLMSFHEPGSDVSRLNRLALRRATRVDPRTYSVLSRATEFAAASNGVFDVTVAGRLVEWGFLPSPAAGPSPAGDASWRDIEFLDDHRIRFHRPLWIDLGGIAKGYAVDAAFARLARSAPLQVRINAGGDLRLGGPDPEPIRLRLASTAAEVPIVELKDGSLASSSGGEASRLQGSRRVGPHVHGRRRTPMGLRRFVSVIAADCIVADALTKVVMARGARAAPLLRRFGATALLHEARSGWRTIGA